jgi:hypothetical protein
MAAVCLGRATRMTTYLVLLRGINVGGKNKVAMASLRVGSDALVDQGREPELGEDRGDALVALVGRMDVVGRQEVA